MKTRAANMAEAVARLIVAALALFAFAAEALATVALMAQLAARRARAWWDDL